MKTLKRVVYHINGTDYEANEVIELTFKLQLVSIHNVLAVSRSFGVKVKSYGKTEYGFPLDVKTFVMQSRVKNMVNFLFSLGFKEHSEVYGTIIIQHNKFRSNANRSKRYNGIMCYDPTSHSWELKSNAPAKITGTQAIINGKLWRKYYER